jgi:hypothetical protein
MQIGSWRMEDICTISVRKNAARLLRQTPQNTPRLDLQNPKVGLDDSWIALERRTREHSAGEVPPAADELEHRER